MSSWSNDVYDLSSSDLVYASVKNIPLLLQKGDSHFIKKRFEEALEYYKQAEEIESQVNQVSLSVLHNAAVCCAHIGQTDECLLRMRRAVSTFPRNGPLRENCAYLYMYLGRFESAMKEFDILSTLVSVNPIHAQLGEADCFYKLRAYRRSEEKAKSIVFLLLSMSNAEYKKWKTELNLARDIMNLSRSKLK